ncbi:MAG: hypothetical protein CM1200mP10_02730 [Candidatus Neomarinimicrobiota bacterium]|nr:MAG: hypothetical protein CM1200mP10_02730 [Candidatus Neomarinimicrobiota bacterium]
MPNLKKVRVSGNGAIRSRARSADVTVNAELLAKNNSGWILELMSSNMEIMHGIVKLLPPA